MLQQNIEDMRSDKATATCIEHQHKVIDAYGASAWARLMVLYL